MGGKASRTKGHDFERFCARLVRSSFPDARRGKQFTGGREADVEGTPFRIECKRLKDVKLGDVKRALQQAEGDAYEWEDDRPCVAIHRADREVGYVTIKLETAATIVERMFFREPDNVIPIVTPEVVDQAREDYIAALSARVLAAAKNWYYNTSGALPEVLEADLEESLDNLFAVEGTEK